MKDGSRKPECDAIEEITAILDRLDDQKRLAAFFHVGFSMGMLNQNAVSVQVSDVSSESDTTVARNAHDMPAGQEVNDPCGFQALSELISYSNAKTQLERVLLAAHWIANCDSNASGTEGFTSADLRAALEDARVKPGNVADSLAKLAKKKFLFSLKKGGQGSKRQITWQISNNGTERVKELLNGPE